jgi:hypothetical protein
MNRNQAVVAQTCFGGLRFFPNRQQKAADLNNRSALRLLEKEYNSTNAQGF